MRDPAEQRCVHLIDISAIIIRPRQRTLARGSIGVRSQTRMPSRQSLPPEIALQRVGYRPDDNVLIIGGPASGKSWLLHYLVSVWETDRRIILPDLLGNLRPSSLPQNWIELGPHASETRLMQALATNTSIYIPVPRSDYGPDLAAFVESVGDIVRHVPDEPPALLVLDEAQYSGYQEEAAAHPLAFVQRRPERSIPRGLDLLAEYITTAGMRVPTVVAERTRRRSLSVVVSVQHLVHLTRIPTRFDVIIVGGNALQDEAEAVGRLYPGVLPGPEIIQALPTGGFFVVRRYGRLSTRISRTDVPAGW
jgi:hypothetical protein